MAFGDWIDLLSCGERLTPLSCLHGKYDDAVGEI